MIGSPTGCRMTGPPADQRGSAASARLSTLNIGVTGSSARSVSPSGRLKLASSAPTNARSSASVGGSAAIARHDEGPADLAEDRHPARRRPRRAPPSGARQEVLDLARIDVVAAADEHLALPAAEVQVARRRRGSRGRRCGPSPRRRWSRPRGLVVAPVAAHRRRRAHAHTADLAGGERPAGRVRRCAARPRASACPTVVVSTLRLDRPAATPSRCRPRWTSSGR